MQISSRAKINWLLNVGGKRSDGYHEILTVFHEIELADTIDIIAQPDPVCQISGFAPDLAPENNLIHRAWNSLRNRFPERVGGIFAEVKKVLPAGGGLGGGSSNAAACLRAVNELFELGLQPTQLAEVGLEIGSDVPFFLIGGCAWGRGRGEDLTPMHAPDSFDLVLVFPGEPVSTAMAYTQLDNQCRDAKNVDDLLVAKVIAEHGIDDLAGIIDNDFELVVRETTWFRQIQSALQKAGCPKGFLSGSGSTMVGLTRGKDHAESVVQHLQGSLPYKALVTRTVKTV